MQKLRPQTSWHHNLPAPLRKSPSPDIARDTIRITIPVGTSRPREPAPGQAEGFGRAKPGSFSAIAALLARRRFYALRPHSVFAGIDYLNLVSGCLGECLWCRPRRGSRPAASSRAGSHGDAQSEIVGLDQNRHHRRRRRIPNHCRASRRLFCCHRQSRLCADSAGRHRRLGNRTRGSFSIANRNRKLKGHGRSHIRSCIY